MPVFITQRTQCKRDSMASFSTSLSVGEFGSFDSTLQKQPYLPTSSISKETIPSPDLDITLPTLPQLTLDINAVPPHTPDAPHSRRSSIDV